MPTIESYFPSDEWQTSGKHWHAYIDTRKADEVSRIDERIARRDRTPNAVLFTPQEVAKWIDEQTRKYVLHEEVWAIHERQWVSIGDEDDLEHLRQQNYIIASRGDSIYTDIHTVGTRHDLYVEAVTNEQCQEDCANKDRDGDVH